MLSKLVSLASLVLLLAAFPPAAVADSIQHAGSFLEKRTYPAASMVMGSYELSAPSSFVKPYFFICCGKYRGPIDNFEATFLGEIKTLLVSGDAGCNTTSTAMMVSIICPNGIDKGHRIKLIPLDSNNHRVKLASACWSFTPQGSGSASCVSRAVAVPEPRNLVLVASGLLAMWLFSRRCYRRVPGAPLNRALYD